MNTLRHLTDTLLFRLLLGLRGIWLVTILTLAMESEVMPAFHTLVVKAMGVNHYTQRYGFSGITGKSKAFLPEQDWFYR